MVRTILLKVGVAAAWGAGAALLVAEGVEHLHARVGRAGCARGLVMVVGGLVGLAVTFGLMTLLRVSEMTPGDPTVAVGLVKRGRAA